MKAALPPDGTLVLDVSRMLPGAVLARTLVDLGARVDLRWGHDERSVTASLQIDPVVVALALGM